MRFNNKQGFTLIETAIVIIIAGLFMAAAARLYQVQLEQERQVALEDTFRNIQAALTDFLDKNGVYPCPAPQDAQPDTAVFGRATNCANTSVAPGNCDGGICVSADHGRRVRIGAVPVRDLGLSMAEYADPYGRQITYAVTESLATTVEAFDSIGAIDVVDGGGNSVLAAPNTAHFVLFSHGRDGAGAFTDSGVENGKACNAGASDGENCDGDATFRSAEFSISENVARYDDQIRHSLQFGQINVACPPGEVLTEIRNKQPICKSLQSLSCPPGQTLNGFNADGNPICSVFRSLAGLSCPDGQLVGAYDAEGAPVCREDKTGEGGGGGSQNFSGHDLTRDVAGYCRQQGFTSGYCTGEQSGICQSLTCIK